MGRWGDRGAYSALAAPLPGWLGGGRWGGGGSVWKTGPEKQVPSAGTTSWGAAGPFHCRAGEPIKTKLTSKLDFPLHWLPCHCMALIFDCQKLHQYFTTSATLLPADLSWTQFPSENSKGKALYPLHCNVFCWKNVLTWSGETDACWFLVSRNVCRGKLKWSEHVESILGPWRQTISVSGGPEPRLRGKRRKAHARTHACAVIQDHHKWPFLPPLPRFQGQFWSQFNPNLRWATFFTQSANLRIKILRPCELGSE